MNKLATLSLLLASTACLIVPPTAPPKLLIVSQERSRYEALFALELQVCAEATRLDTMLHECAGDRLDALRGLSACRLAVAPLAEASVDDPAGLVAAVGALDLEAATPWTVEHVPLWSTLTGGRRAHADWRFGGLSLGLAQQISGAPPALGGASNAGPGATRFVVLEGDETLRFGSVALEAARDDGAWNARPYTFAGALDPAVARALVNVAADCRDPPAASLFDPCCGSGTTLRAAAARGLRAAGADRDAKAVAGASKNLEAYDADVFERDGSLPFPAHGAECCVLNPPWGEKVRDDFGANDRILANLAAASAPGTPVALLDREPRSEAAFARLGYDVLHACEIFPGKANRGKASFAGAARVSVLRVL